MSEELDNRGALPRLLEQVRACTLCAAHLPLGPRPVLRAARGARLLIIGQAPGTKVHATGIPWNDPSGDRLRAWMGITRDQFYDTSRIAIMPMGFCYPGRLPRGGDAPPRPECAPQWHGRILAQLPRVELVLLIGSYAQTHYLEDLRKSSLTDTVRHWRDYAPDYLPLPHPSFRNNLWLKQNPWFEQDVLPELQRRIAPITRLPDPPLVEDIDD
jgi:uracil-DNA glycosylase